MYLEILPTDHWDRNTINFLTPHLEAAKRQIRIATGFFTVQGFNLIRGSVRNKQVYILVGYDETSAERLRAKLIEDIMLHLARWDVQDRREAVVDLVQKIQRGEFEIIERDITDFINSRIRSGDHAKLYILDEEKLLLGSSNLTVNGLRYNYESVTSQEDLERVQQWLSWFEGYWNAPDTYDLTQTLLEALLRWLELVSPYDVYLKTILALVPEDDAEAPRGSYKMPVKYQQVVIERMLRQLKNWGGAFLVASTGLGKTVMATHAAYRLKQDGEILNVIVFAPKQVRPDWEQTLKSAGLSYQIFTRDLLDQPARKRNRAVRQMLDALEEVDEKYIIFIDESQRFRNRINASGDRERYSFERLKDIVARKNPKVVLLTATPFAKGVEDLNNQLHLLPHTAPRNTIRDDGQMAFDLIADEIMDTEVWRVGDQDEFFDEFVNLPVCTVISTSQVAKNFAVQTDEGEYLDFGEHRRWLPQIEIRKIKVPLVAEEKMTAALDHGYFKHKMMSFKSRIGFQRTESTVEQNAVVAWMSSPLALAEVLKKTMDDDYDVEFILDQQERQAVLGEILADIEHLTYQDDSKIMALAHYLRGFIESHQKVIIFTERLATAVYLENALTDILPGLRIANAVRQTDTGNYELKDFDAEVYDLILDFAPEANSDKNFNRAKKRPLDVFITTDAYSAGVNLQDASVVISYDIAWTPETIIQRAGRILRFWTKPRRVSLYIFTANFQHDAERQKESLRVEERLRRLVQRTRHAEKFSELPIIPDGEQAQFNSLGSLTDVTIEDLGLVDIAEVEEFTGVSQFLIHITELSQNLDYAKQIPDDITSALIYTGKRDLLYLLMRYEGEFVWTIYDIHHKSLRDMKEDELLKVIRCEKDILAAGVDPHEIEQHAQDAKRKWMKQEGIEQSESVERVCALYLLPSRDEADFKRLLSSI